MRAEAAPRKPHVAVVGAGWGGWCVHSAPVHSASCHVALEGLTGRTDGPGRRRRVARGATKALCEAGCTVTLLDGLPDPTGSTPFLVRGWSGAWGERLYDRCVHSPVLNLRPRTDLGQPHTRRTTTPSQIYSVWRGVLSWAHGSMGTVGIRITHRRRVEPVEAMQGLTGAGVGRTADANRKAV